MYLCRYYVRMFLLLNQKSEIHKLEDLLKTHTLIFSSSLKTPRGKEITWQWTTSCPMTPRLISEDSTEWLTCAINTTSACVSPDRWQSLWTQTPWHYWRDCAHFQIPPKCLEPKSSRTVTWTDWHWPGLLLAALQRISSLGRQVGR